MPKVEVKEELPPVWDKASKIFRLSGREVFAYHPYIYNPSGEKLSSPLIVHEKVHLRQQKEHPKEWWECYLASDEFRLEQELEAHIAEYDEYCRVVPNRDKQKNYLTQVSRRLALPMYGNMITYTQAKKRIRHGSKIQHK